MSAKKSEAPKKTSAATSTKKASASNQEEYNDANETAEVDEEAQQLREKMDEANAPAENGPIAPVGTSTIKHSSGNDLVTERNEDGSYKQYIKED